MKVTIPGVGRVEFPDDMPLEDVQSASARLQREHLDRTAPELDLGSKTPEEASNFAAQGNAARATGRPLAIGQQGMAESMARVMDERGMGYVQRAAATLGKAPMDILLSLQQAAQKGELTPEQQADVQAWRALVAGANTGAGNVDWLPDAGNLGEFLGGAALGAGGGAPVAAAARALPGAARIAQAIASRPVALGTTAGAAGGVAQPVLEGESAAMNAAAGATLGSLLPLTAKVGYGVVPMNQAAQTLVAEGVMPSASGAAPNIPVVSRWWKELDRLASGASSAVRDRPRREALRAILQRTAYPGVEVPEIKAGGEMGVRNALISLREANRDVRHELFANAGPVNASDLLYVAQPVAAALKDAPEAVQRNVGPLVNWLFEQGQKPGQFSAQDLSRVRQVMLERLRDAQKTQQFDEVDAWDYLLAGFDAIQSQHLPEELFPQAARILEADTALKAVVQSAEPSKALTLEGIAKHYDAGRPAVTLPGETQIRPVLDAAAQALPPPSAQSVPLLPQTAVPVAYGAEVIGRALLGATGPQTRLRQTMMSDALRQAMGVQGFAAGSVFQDQRNRER